MKQASSQQGAEGPADFLMVASTSKVPSSYITDRGISRINCSSFLKACIFQDLNSMDPVKFNPIRGFPSQRPLGSTPEALSLDPFQRGLIKQQAQGRFSRRRKLPCRHFLRITMVAFAWGEVGQVNQKSVMRNNMTPLGEGGPPASLHT